MSNTNYKDAELYAELWSDAYDADRMGRETSILVIQAMLDFGLGRDKSEWVYRSKHLRWFFDRYASAMMVKDAHEKIGFFLMSSYLFHNENGVQDDLKTVMCNEDVFGCEGESDAWKHLSPEQTEALKEYVSQNQIQVSTQYGSLFLTVKAAFVHGFESGQKHPTV